LQLLSHSDIPILLAVYYKIYDDDKKEMIPSRHPVGYVNDPCIGRVDAARIPTPHRIGALVAQICKRENRRLGLDFDTEEAYLSMLLRTVDSTEAYRLDDTVDLLGARRPGSTPQEPVLLKVWWEGEQDKNA
jgi:hypothetical protein